MDAYNGAIFYLTFCVCINTLAFFHLVEILFVPIHQSRIIYLEGHRLLEILWYVI